MTDAKNSTPAYIRDVVPAFSEGRHKVHVGLPNPECAYFNGEAIKP